MLSRARGGSGSNARPGAAATPATGAAAARPEAGTGGGGSGTGTADRRAVTGSAAGRRGRARADAGPPSSPRPRRCRTPRRGARGHPARRAVDRAGGRRRRQRRSGPAGLAHRRPRARRAAPASAPRSRPSATVSAVAVSPSRPPAPRRRGTGPQRLDGTSAGIAARRRDRHRAVQLRRRGRPGLEPTTNVEIGLMLLGARAVRRRAARHPGPRAPAPRRLGARRLRAARRLHRAVDRVVDTRPRTRGWRRTGPSRISPPSPAAMALVRLVPGPLGAVLGGVALACVGSSALGAADQGLPGRARRRRDVRAPARAVRLLERRRADGRARASSRCCGSARAAPGTRRPRRSPGRGSRSCWSA